MQNNKDDQYDVTIGFLNMGIPKNPQMPAGQPVMPPVNNIPQGAAVPPVNNMPQGAAVPPVNNMPQGAVVPPVNNIPQGAVVPPVNNIPQGAAVPPVNNIPQGPVVSPANMYREPVKPDDSEKTIGMFSYMKPPINNAAQIPDAPPVNNTQPTAAVPPVNSIPQQSAPVANVSNPQNDDYERTIGMFSSIPPMQPVRTVSPAGPAPVSPSAQSTEQETKKDTNRIEGEYPAYSKSEQTYAADQSRPAAKPNIGGIVLLVLGLVYIVFNIVVLMSGFSFAIFFMVIGIALVVAGIKKLKDSK